jgi:hypothetical protein
VGDMSKVNGFTPEQIHLGRVWARVYESKGWQCYPSEATVKKPFCYYSNFWNGGAPSVDELWDKWPSGNIQVQTGRYEWHPKQPGVCVLDLDGPEAVQTFGQWCADRGQKVPYTWTVVNDRKHGRHLWFSLPKWFINSPGRGKSRLWGEWDPTGGPNKEGGWEKGKAIELLCDRSLAMAPPSTHPKRGVKYGWLQGRSPKQLDRPMMIPDWLLSKPTVTGPIPEAPDPVLMLRGKRSDFQWDGEWLPRGLSPKMVRESIQDKIGLVRTWGVRVTDKRENANGWKQCHAITKEDKHPSASFNPTSGRYWEAGWNEEKSICLFRLAVERGIYADWHEACVALARVYCSEFFKGKERGKENR